MPAGQITELEAAVLFLLEKDGPSTAYRIRQALAASPTAHFSGSTGAVYPLIRRLQRRGLLSSRREATGKRSHRICSITAPGRNALRRWVFKPPDSELGVPFDPIITRVNMLAVVSRSEARNFLWGLIEDLERNTEQLSPRIAELARLTPPFGQPAGRFVQKALRARIQFLRRLLSDLPAK